MESKTKRLSILHCKFKTTNYIIYFDNQIIVLLFSFFEWAIAFCVGLSLGVAYQHSIVAKPLMPFLPEEEFQPTLIPGILMGIICIGSVLLQIMFRLFVYFNVTDSSNNLLSLKSALLLFLSLFINSLANIFLPNWLKVISKIGYIVKFFVLPLEILHRNEEAKTYFKLHNPKILNTIPTAIQYFQLLQSKVIQLISFIKNQIYGPSNQVAPVEMIELEDVV